MANNNTFLGLQSYTEEDAYRFKGRTEESQELFRIIIRNDYTVCYAESGEGKTSLLNAGVSPLLRENMLFPIAITFTIDDYKQTPENFDTIIHRCIKDSIVAYNEKNKNVIVEYKLCSTDFQDSDKRTRLQQELEGFSWWELRNFKPKAMGLTFTPVFIFDQFEEIFTQPESVVWTKKFFDWLEDVSSDNCPDIIVNKVREIIGIKATFPTIKEKKDFKAIFSLRKEFIGELDYWSMQKNFIPDLKNNRYCLKALTYEGAQRVMAQQESFDEATVKQLLNYFLKQYSREPEKTICEGLPAIPALLLSIVCDSWEKDANCFSNMDTNGIGQSLNNILEKFYCDALSDIVNELSQKESNNHVESISSDIETALFALVDSKGKRIRRKSSELSRLDFDEKYKDILISKRIIKASKVDGEYYVEIVHDALCPIIAKRKEEKFLNIERQQLDEKEKLLEINRKRNRIYLNVLCLLLSIIFIVLTILTSWSSSTGIKGYLTSIDHHGIWTYEDVHNYDWLPLTDSLSIDVPGKMTISNNLAIKKVRFNTDSVDLTVYKGENLQNIILGDDVVKARIDIDAFCKSLLHIYIGKKVSQLTIQIDGYQTDSLVFDISPENIYYKWDYCFTRVSDYWRDNIVIGFLWDKRDGSIVHMSLPKYFNMDGMVFPNDFMQANNHSQITYNSISFSNVSIDVSNFYAYGGSKLESYTLKQKGIGFGAFARCKNLKSIIGYPETIEMAAFAGCEKLESISLDSVAIIYDYAFYNCHSLKEVNLSRNYDTEDPDTVLLGRGVFNNCWSLKSVRFPKVLLLTSMTDHLRTFENCLQLEEVYLPDTIKVYDSMHNIYSEDNIEAISTLFSNCPKISKVHCSPHSLFRKDTTSKIIYYKDIPVIFNMAEDFKWANKDSLFYQRDGILYSSIDDHIIHIPSISSLKDYPNWNRIMRSNYYNNGDTLIYMFPDTIKTTIYLPYIGKYKGRISFSFPLSTNNIKEIHSPFAEPRMWAFDEDLNIIYNRDKIVLYVPWGTKQVYEKDYRFRDFKEIREDSFGWRMYMTIHYVFNSILSKPWKFIVLAIMTLPVFSMTRNRIKKEKEKYNIAVKYTGAIFTSFCMTAAYYCAFLFIFIYIDYHLIF